MKNALDVLLNTPPARRGNRIVDLVLTERAKILRAREMGHTWAAIASALGLKEEQGKYLSVVWSRIEARINAKDGVK
jgi:hypothetical protein